MSQPRAIPTITAALASLLSLASVQVNADNDRRRSEVQDVDVRITNLTQGTLFTPALVVAHRRASDVLFTPGGAPSDALAALAEGGDTEPLRDLLESDDRVWSTAEADAPLGPGESVTIRLAAVPARSAVSLAAMLLPTNDGFVAVQGLRIPSGRFASSTWAEGYDAGSEPNDELCANIPGPDCNGVGGSPDAGGEGYVHIHSGIHGIGDLEPSLYDWRNPVARVEVTRAD
ncbi:spondin domain-containing protein [Thiorhodococcus minor]|uniref:Spondin domain-containing protein n=1 Tax=Thiorhodococcus minor TaxID=57489 RepID=A0A6M0K546_9GAMM|nr:spondin domain-containing protein [Thiorhodococcus minor]NEV64906.1 hypothetical protein [Thiorhodococcus minor]